MVTYHCHYCLGAYTSRDEVDAHEVDCVAAPSTETDIYDDLAETGRVWWTD